MALGERRRARARGEGPVQFACLTPNVLLQQVVNKGLRFKHLLRVRHGETPEEQRIAQRAHEGHEASKGISKREARACVHVCV